MGAEAEPTHDELPELGPALRVELDDPEVMRARAAIEARLLGTTPAPFRIGRFVVLERIGAGGMGVVYAAYDPQLDRRVAIKLLFARRSGAREHGRLVDEAKAMAKLAHPNVAHVYEVGEHQGQLFLAMELVHGRTLRRWWSDAPHTVRATLTVCLEAGAGLAAAHAAGIVHRDFKPDNVLVDDDPLGRARVLDFGLAQAMDEPTVPDVATGPVACEAPATTTRTGRRMGTPGYIAPELLRGATADRHSDQFSFCVTVWEALVGTPPFRGKDVHELLDAIAHGRIEAPPRAKMPAWVERVLRRGLADERDAPFHGRYASLDELLAALARDPAAVRRRRLGIAAAAACIIAAFVVGNAIRPTPTGASCSGAEEAIAAAWPAAERATAIARVAEIGGVYGAVVAPQLTDSADAYASAWATEHREACLAHERGEQSADLLDRRMVCLSRGRSAFRTLAGITATIEAPALGQLVVAFDALPPPQRCADLPALTAVAEPAPAASLPLADALADAQMLFAAGETDAALTAAAKVLADARRIGYRPRIAEALSTHGWGLLERRKHREGAIEMKEATLLALEVGDERLAVAAWGAGAWAVATTDPNDVDPQTKFEGRELMTAIAERLGDDQGAMAFYNRLGGIELANSRHAQARAAYGRALEIGAKLDGVEARVANIEEGLALIAEDPVSGAQHFDRAVEASVVAYGTAHPRTLSLRTIRAVYRDDAHAVVEELVPLCNEWHTYHPGEAYRMAQCERELARVAELVGDRPLARAATERWANAGGDFAELGRGMAAFWNGDAARAAAIIEPVVRKEEGMRTDDAPFFVWINLGDLELGLGRAWRELGDPRAQEMLARALADTERGIRDRPQTLMQRRVAYARAVIAAN